MFSCRNPKYCFKSLRGQESEAHARIISHRKVNFKLNQTYRFGIDHRNLTVCYMGRILGETAHEQFRALLEG